MVELNSLRVFKSQRNVCHTEISFYCIFEKQEEVEGRFELLPKLGKFGRLPITAYFSTHQLRQLRGCVSP
jgi:hypothetical protein